MKRLFLSLSTIVTLAVSLFAADNVAPSQKPPAGIEPANAPMFVILGWDDNSYADAFTWFLDFMKDKTNKNGTPARTTFFNTSERASSLVVAETHQTAADVLNSWKRAYNEGHEIANHTVNHGHGKAYDGAKWTEQIGGCNTFLKEKVGVGEVYGFRTPFLEFGAGTFDALRTAGLLYDCSVEYGYGAGSTQFIPGGSEWGDWVSTGSETGRKYGLYWPFTLDKGAPQGAYTNSADLTVPGFWEFMVNTYLLPVNLAKDTTHREITGFDYNVFWSGSGNYSAEDVVEIWKYNFDLQRAGWKAPLMLNIHTDYYSDWNEDAKVNFTKSTVASRRKAIEDFITYVLQFDDVRVIPAVDVIKWMRNPQPYQSDNTGPFELAISATHGSVVSVPSKNLYAKGETVSLTATPDVDYQFTGWSGGATGTTNPVTVTVNSNMSVTANFKYHPASYDSYFDMMTGAEFTANKDELGSTNTMTATTALVTSSWSEPKRDSTQYPSVSVEASLPSGTLKGAGSITISYKSDKPLILALPQPSLAATGESYKFDLPAGDTTITIEIGDFTIPSWSAATTQLALDSISSVTIEPNVESETIIASVSGSFEISELKIYGIDPTGTAPQIIRNKTGFSVAVVNNSLQFSTPTVSTVEIYNAQGKELATYSNLTGAKSVVLPTSLGNGVYVYRINANGLTMTGSFVCKQ